MLATLGACICIQIATNFFNDALDSMKGSDTKERLGPVRITASGMMSPRAVIGAGIAVLAVATLLSIPLIWYRGWPIIAIGIPSLYFCYGYTGGPVPLAYRGLGELFVVLFFGLVAVTGSAFVQSGQWHWQALVAGMQVGALSTVLIAINNLRDIAEDTKTGKRTLAVRFGKTFARWEIVTLLAVALALWFCWFPLIKRPDVPLAYIFLGPFVFIPLLFLSFRAVKIGRGVMITEPSAAYNGLLVQAGKLLMLHSMFFSMYLYFMV
jgi:1,4-dihydroxy-2-naphthoate octaprenyltransferase